MVLTLTQTEALLLIRSGRRTFSGRPARSIERLVDDGLVTAEFDLTSPDPLRGRIREVWRNCALTTRGLQVCDTFTARFQPLMSDKEEANA